MDKQQISLKVIPYHELLALKDTVERLSSWEKPLQLLQQFFGDHNSPLNKRKIIKEYHSSALLFQLFFENYQLLLSKESEILIQMNQHQKAVSQELQAENPLTHSPPAEKKPLTDSGRSRPSSIDG